MEKKDSKKREKKKWSNPELVALNADQTGVACGYGNYPGDVCNPGRGALPGQCVSGTQVQGG